MNKHQDLAVLGLLLTSFVVTSCGAEDPPTEPPRKTFEEIRAEADAAAAANPADLFPMDNHRNRSLRDWIAEIEGDDRFKCFRAIVAVGEMEEKGALAVPAIVKCLHDPDVDGGVKRKAIASLGRIGGLEAAQGLDSCMRGSDAVLGVLAADSLGTMGSWAVDLIVPYLSSPNPDVRERGARALKSVLATDGTVTKMEAAVVPLAHALGDESPGVREAALGVLSELGPRAVSATPVIIEKLQGETNREQRKLLMVMVGMFGSAASDAAPLLRSYLKEDDAQIRLFAALSLAKVGFVDEGLEPLIAFLADDDPQMRLASADALRRIGPPARPAVEPLKQARKGANDALHLLIEQAIEAIRGH